MVKDDPLAFRFDCGATWLNLLATRGRAFSGRPVERLADVGRFAEWLARCELSPVRPPEQTDLERARLLRETLRPLALASVDGDPPPREAVATLAGFLGDDRMEIAAGERLVRKAPPTVDAALGRVARQAVDHLTGPERGELKVCPEHDCRGVFTDRSGRRRWCPSPACASRGRVRALRARRSADSNNA